MQTKKHIRFWYKHFVVLFFLLLNLFLAVDTLFVPNISASSGSVTQSLGLEDNTFGKSLFRESIEHVRIMRQRTIVPDVIANHYNTLVTSINTTDTGDTHFWVRPIYYALLFLCQLF